MSAPAKACSVVDVSAQFPLMVTVTMLPPSPKPEVAPEGEASERGGSGGEELIRSDQAGRRSSRESRPIVVYGIASCSEVHAVRSVQNVSGKSGREKCSGTVFRFLLRRTEETA